MLEKVKRLLAIVILACMFLPIAQCSSTQGAATDQMSQKQSLEALVPFNVIKADWRTSIPMTCVYLWPLPFVVFRRYLRSRPRVNAGASALELLFASASLYVLIETVRALGTLRYGGVLAITAFLVYFLLAAISLRRHLRERSLDSVLQDRTR